MRYEKETGEKIPRARVELLKIAQRLRDIEDIEDIEDIAKHIEDIEKELMYRNIRKKPKARTKQVKITPALVREIKAFVKQNSLLHERDIGRKFGVDGGRVSEIIQGHRTEAHPQGTPEWRGVSKL
jgi:predicted XRE-type DNA-binding protein